LERLEAKILRELAYSNKTVWELLERSDRTLRESIGALRHLYKEGLIGEEKGVFYLTEKGKQSVNPKELQYKTRICKVCGGKRIVGEAGFKDLAEKFKEIVKERPQPTLEYFQGYMVAEDVLARVALMHHYGDLCGKNIVLIGDDDLLSVALALTQLPSRITVLDIDRRIGEFISRVNSIYGFNIEYIEYDVANPLPKTLAGRFDVFTSEPLETLSGLKAFLIRGITCLKEGSVGYFGLTLHEASLRKWLETQRLLSKMNCVITDIIQGFSSYPMDYNTVNYEKFAYNLGFRTENNPGVNWYKSALIRFEVLSAPNLAYNKRRKVKIVDTKEDLTHPTLYPKLLRQLNIKDESG
jgi:predicted methyltransferase